ncbi:MAG TPA: hypothetical protein VF470_00095 [Sphingomicrobium sp.]|jgi:hypothetical protein
MKARMIMLMAVAAGSCSQPSPQPIAAPKKIAELSGRTAGKTQRCLPGPRDVIFEVSRSDPSLLLHDDGKRIWVSRAGPDCQFQSGQTVIPDTLAAYYCSGDLVRVGGATNLFPASRYCALGSFTPYAAAK